MNVVDRIVRQLNAHGVRESEYRAKCPAHQGRSDTSLSIKDTGDRVLLHCWNGCSLEAITSAMELQRSDLFTKSRLTPLERAGFEHVRRIESGFQAWRESETLDCATELRSRDQARLSINSAVAAGELTADAALEKLAPIYQGYSELEHRFDVLRTGTDAEALEIYRNV